MVYDDWLSKQKENDLEIEWEQKLKRDEVKK